MPNKMCRPWGCGQGRVWHPCIDAAVVPDPLLHHTYVVCIGSIMHAFCCRGESECVSRCGRSRFSEDAKDADNVACCQRVKNKNKQTCKNKAKEKEEEENWSTIYYLLSSVGQRQTCVMQCFLCTDTS